MSIKQLVWCVLKAEGNICQQLGDRKTNYLCKFTILLTVTNK